MTLRELLDLTWETFAIVQIVEKDVGSCVFGHLRNTGRSQQIFKLDAEAWAQLQDDMHSIWDIEHNGALAQNAIMHDRDRYLGVAVLHAYNSRTTMTLWYGLTTWEHFDRRWDAQARIRRAFDRRFEGAEEYADEARRTLIDALGVMLELERFDLDRFADEHGWLLRQPDPYDFEVDATVDAEVYRRAPQARMLERERIRETILIERYRAALQSSIPTDARKRVEESLAGYEQMEAARVYEDKVQAGEGQEPFAEERFVGALAALEGVLSSLDLSPDNIALKESVRTALAAVLQIEPLNRWNKQAHTKNVDEFIERVSDEVSSWYGEPTMPPSRVVLGELFGHTEDVCGAVRRTEWERAARRARDMVYEARAHVKRDIFRK
ncbi:hypothetical protein EPN44_01370 [bacterium]|nr:MAG: hypothetical protein EPN44_01370 [bacterium]